MATAGHRQRARRAARVAVAVAVAALALSAGTPPAPAEEDARTRRDALLVQAAELADRLESTQAAVVAAQLGRDSASGRLLELQRRRRDRAVTAYMRGTGASVAALAAPRAYLEVLAAKERELLAGHHAAVEAAVDAGRRAEAARASLRDARERLTVVQAELDAAVTADDARAEEQRRSDEARRAALARQAAELAEARGRAQAGATPPAGSYAPSPLDPDALVPRHRAATDRQSALMRRVPFGVLAAGPTLPAGLVATGQRVEGEASWYGPGFNGRPTASGAIYDQEAWTVASRDLPLGTFLVVTRGDRRVLLLVNDRGPYVDGRVLDLSSAAARALGVGGVASVSAEVVAAG